MASRHVRYDAENRVRSWGYNKVYTWTDRPNCHYPPHSHPGPTTHLILYGDLTLKYPDDPELSRITETGGPGARIDVPAGKRHEVWIGDEGCTYVIGECL